MILETCRESLKLHRSKQHHQPHHPLNHHHLEVLLLLHLPLKHGSDCPLLLTPRTHRQRLTNLKIKKAQASMTFLAFVTYEKSNETPQLKRTCTGRLGNSDVRYGENSSPCSLPESPITRRYASPSTTPYSCTARDLTTF